MSAARVIDRGWSVLSSERTTAFLVLVLSVFAAVAALVPQGEEALELARDRGAATLHALARWGLTDVFRSDWVFAVGALLAGNLAALIFSGAGKARTVASSLAKPPAGAPLRSELEAPYPEAALETVRQVLQPHLGRPAAEIADGSRATLLFDDGLGAELAPMFTHLGLMVLVLGAGLYESGSANHETVPRAVLEVVHPASNTSGVFDMIAGQPVQFFQLPSQYTLQRYEGVRDGLGPAVYLERMDGRGQEGSGFWVYQNAPQGFDARHRDGEVHIVARSMGRIPFPGAGLADSPLGALLLFGLGALAFGAIAGGKPRGRIWVEADGNRVTVTGVPERPGHRGFTARFDRACRTAAAALSS